MTTDIHEVPKSEQHTTSNKIQISSKNGTVTLTAKFCEVEFDVRNGFIKYYETKTFGMMKVNFSNEFKLETHVKEISDFKVFFDLTVEFEHMKPVIFRLWEKTENNADLNFLNFSDELFTEIQKEMVRSHTVHNEL